MNVGERAASAFASSTSAAQAQNLESLLVVVSLIPLHDLMELYVLRD